ncbi:MAG: hypothetical protein JWR84_2322 [Caulobacter sp.]|nr:hypothetical protein [Caulobacter sp.]
MLRLVLSAGLSAALVLSAGSGFAQAPTAPPKVATAAPSAKAMDLSKRYFKAMRLDETLGKALDNLDPALLSGEDGDPQQAEAMRAATKLALDAAMPKYIEKMTPLLASAYSEDELAALVAFYESPVGQSVVAKSRDIGGISSQAMKDLLPGIMDDAMDRYCQQMGCEDEGYAEMARQTRS